MKGLVTRLVKLFLGWVVVVAGVTYGLHLATGRPLVQGLGAALLAGSLGWMAAACLAVAIRSLRERSAIRRGTRELPTKDGPTVLIGRIDTARPVVGPLDGRDCVAYTYEVSRDVKSGRSWTRFVLYKGVGLAPSQIVTGAGTFRLLAVPTIEGADAADAPAGGHPAALRALSRRDDLHEANRGRRRRRRRRARSALERQRWRLPQRHRRRQRLGGRARRLSFRTADRSPRRAGLPPGSLLDDPTRHRPGSRLGADDAAAARRPRRGQRQAGVTSRDAVRLRDPPRPRNGRGPCGVCFALGSPRQSARARAEQEFSREELSPDTARGLRLR